MNKRCKTVITPPPPPPPKKKKKKKKNEPAHDKTNKMACVPFEDLDQPGHPHSLISLHCPHEESFGP